MNLETDTCAINVSIVCDKSVLPIQRTLSIPLTATTDIRSKRVQVDTSMTTAIPYEVVVQESGAVFQGAHSRVSCREFIRAGDLVYVFCWDPVFGRNVLFARILKFLKRQQQTA